MILSEADGLNSPCSRSLRGSCAWLQEQYSRSGFLPSCRSPVGMYPRITERFGMEGTLQIISCHPTGPAMGRDPFPQPRVLRAPSSLALNPAREGAAIASLGSLGQGLTTLTGKSFFLIADLNLPVFSLKPSPLVLSYTT